MTAQRVAVLGLGGEVTLAFTTASHSREALDAIVGKASANTIHVDFTADISHAVADVLRSVYEKGIPVGGELR